MKTIEFYSRVVAFASVVMLMSAMPTLGDGTTSTNLEKDYTGTINQVDVKQSTLEVKGFLSSKKFNLGSSCVYVLLEKPFGAITDLRSGQKVKVFYQDANGILAADRVEQQPQSFEGRVTSIDTTNGILKLSAHWEEKSFQMGSNCAIVLHNDQSGSPGDIQIGGNVTVTYEEPGNALIATRIAQTSAVYTGTATAIDLPNRTITAKALLGSKKFSIADGCPVVIHGKTDGQLTDLKPDERLVFSYDEVNGVNVVNRIASAPVETDTNSTYITQPGTGY